jgi:hypothetical protein
MGILIIIATSIDITGKVKASGSFRTGVRFPSPPPNKILYILHRKACDCLVQSQAFIFIMI